MQQIGSLETETDLKERQDREWGEFLDRLVHDLREPLRTINAFSELLNEITAGQLGTEGEEVIGEILRGSVRIKTLTDGLSGYALALRAAPDAAPSGGVALSSAFNIALAALGPEIDEAAADVQGIEATGNEALPKIAMKLERLTQLLENVIGNSLRFRGEDAPAIRMSAKSGVDGMILVEVADNGIGLDSADCESVFRPFMRVHGREYGGAGLGLAICRRIVDAHGGAIQLSPGAAGGAICSFSLPAARPGPLPD